MKMYIIHYKMLNDRKVYLDQALSRFEFPPIYIDEFDRNTLDLNNINPKYNKRLWEDRVYGLYANEPDIRDLKISEICNSLSHIKALKFISDDIYQYSMILEDDVILPKDFLEKVVDMLGQIPKDADFIFFGSSFSIPILDNANLSKSIKVKNNIYKKELGKTRTVDAYIVSKYAAKTIVDEINEICLPFDFELNYFFKKLNMNVYWFEPGIVQQGSQIGKYKSSIR